MSATTAPPAGAMAFSVTVADKAEPDATDGDDNVTAFTAVAATGDVGLVEPPPVTDPPLVVVEPPLVVEPLPAGATTPAGEAENEPEGFAQPIETSNALIVNAIVREWFRIEKYRTH